MMFNTSDIMGAVIINFTNTVTGDLYLTLFSFIFLIFMFFLALRLPIELSTILIVPLIIVFAAYSGADWKGFAGVLLFYLAIMFGRFFMR